ncbi:hypothetical protein PENSPDRAFT_688746 [Peniophora sp. CONT]|nr:hypothetical protein PENSPDRAFT_688746 [Peniophora sp. CONT]
MAVATQKPLPLAKAGLTRETSYVYTPPSHRLLFRGSLSVPGSRLLLEGLTFTVSLKSSPAKLLENPLALALESMRGRTLALSGITRLDAVHLDRSTEVNLDIHPAASLTRLYFENQLCAEPITSEDGCTDVGVRVSIGSSGNEGPSDIVIYGKLADEPQSTSTPTSTSKQPTLPPLKLLVARILPTPPPRATRLPRPDDPSPRVPPLVSFGKKRQATADPVHDTPSHKRQKSARALTRKDSASAIEEDPMLSRARELMKPPAKSLERSNSLSLRRSVSIADEDVFKVPSVPVRKVAEKAPEKVPDIAKELEKANKATIKRATMDYLTAIGLTKDNPEFKDIFNFVYRGAEFAMRAQMKARAVDTRLVDKFIRAHADMYVKGTVPRAK